MQKALARPGTTALPQQTSPRCSEAPQRLQRQKLACSQPHRSPILVCAAMSQRRDVQVTQTAQRVAFVSPQIPARFLLRQAAHPQTHAQPRTVYVTCLVFARTPQPPPAEATQIAARGIPASCQPWVASASPTCLVRRRKRQVALEMTFSSCPSAMFKTRPANSLVIPQLSLLSPRFHQIETRRTTSVYGLRLMVVSLTLQARRQLRIPVQQATSQRRQVLGSILTTMPVEIFKSRVRFMRQYKISKSVVMTTRVMVSSPSALR